jgi:DNA-binding transcriptional regulator YdaS (Cro superfamily)
MDLGEFLKSLPRGSGAAFADKLGISRIYLQQLGARQDGREPSPELCVSIERESLRQVRRWDLRPTDWHRIWPELIGTEGAPDVPSAANEHTARAAG